VIVLRFQVAVDDARLVRGGQRVGERRTMLTTTVGARGAGAVYVFGEGLALGPFESEVIQASASP